MLSLLELKPGQKNKSIRAKTNKQKKKNHPWLERITHGKRYHYRVYLDCDENIYMQVKCIFHMYFSSGSSKYNPSISIFVHLYKQPPSNLLLQPHFKTKIKSSDSIFFTKSAWDGS